MVEITLTIVNSHRAARGGLVAHGLYELDILRVYRSVLNGGVSSTVGHRHISILKIVPVAGEVLGWTRHDIRGHALSVGALIKRVPRLSIRHIIKLL